MSDVAVTLVGTPKTPPAKLTRSAPPKPVPLTVKTRPTAPLRVERLSTFGSMVKSLAVCVRPPAFVTPILPIVALFGTVTLRDVPPTPTMNAAAWVLFPNFTLVVPVNVFPERTM